MGVCHVHNYQQWVTLKLHCRYRSMAEKADEDAIDVDRLSEVWPEEKPSNRIVSLVTYEIFLYLQMIVL